MADKVRHHRADVMGVTEPKRRINRVFEIQSAEIRMGIQGACPLVRGISHENPFAQAKRPTKKLGRTKQACANFKHNRF